MASTNSNVRQFDSQPDPLTTDEIRRIAEKIATALDDDLGDVALLTLLLDYIAHQKKIVDVVNAIEMIKRHLLINSGLIDKTQARFQAQAYKNRGRLLMWPGEQKGAN